MNTRTFKTLIKECVREVIKEELSDILKEAILNNSQVKHELNEGTSFSFNTNDVITKPSNSTFRSKMNEMYGINTPQNIHKTKEVEAVIETIGGSKNKFANLFAQTAAEMTPQDRANLSRID